MRPSRDRKIEAILDDASAWYNGRENWTPQLGPSDERTPATDELLDRIFERASP